jgi:hypothetical protein
MGQFLPPLLFAILLLGAVKRITSQTPGNAAPQTDSSIALPSGSKVEMALTRPVWAAKAKAGDTLYLQTVFPVTIGNRIGIPAGTFVQGTIDSIVAPTRKVDRAEIDVHFNQIVFADGYTVMLSGAETPAATTSTPATLSMVTVQVSRSNDILLDNGSQIEMTLEAPLVLDAVKVAQAMPLSHAPAPGQFRPATLCRTTPGDPGTPGTSGTPGTPDTVIPGTPGTPGTADSPGTPGTPDIVIPGTPATPGMPGTPGSPGSVCPAPPLVISSTPGGATPPGGVVVKQTPAPKKKTRLQDEKKGQP